MVVEWSIVVVTGKLVLNVNVEISVVVEVSVTGTVMKISEVVVV